MLFRRVPPRLYTTQLSPPISTKLPDICATASGSVMPVCCGQPAAGASAMTAVSTRSFARAMEDPTAPVANRTRMVSTATMMTVRRMRRVRTRARAASRYSTRPAESVSPSAECPPRRILLMNGSPYRSYSTHFKNRPLAGSVGPARLRSRLSRMAGISAGSSRPAPASHKVPARMRTILYR